MENKLSIQEIKDFVEQPKLTIVGETLKVPEKFKFLESFFETVEIVGKQSKTGQKYGKHMLLADEAKQDEGAHFTSDLISSFVSRYLEINDSEITTETGVLDFTAGVGAFVFAIKNIEKAKGIGLGDINVKSLKIAKAVSEKIGLSSVFATITDTLKVAQELPIHLKETTDLLILNPPFNLTSSSNSDFIKLALYMLKDTGKCFIVLPQGFDSSSRKCDVELRKEMIEKGYLEGLVRFPGAIFENTSIPTTMLILSKNKTKGENIKWYDIDPVKLNLPKITKESKVNPLSGRIYKRNTYDGSKYVLDKNTHKTTNIPIETENYVFNLNRYFVDEKEPRTFKKDLETAREIIGELGDVKNLFAELSSELIEVFTSLKMEQDGRNQSEFINSEVEKIFKDIDDAKELLNDDYEKKVVDFIDKQNKEILLDDFVNDREVVKYEKVKEKYPTMKERK